MFRTNNTHLQDDLFNHYQTMKPSIAKMLEKSWAPVFYKEVFCKINEEIYAPLYCLDNGRPNTPVNILLSLEIIKHQFGFTDEEILEQFYFNFQILYALGIRNLGEVYIAERTIYEFRERIYSYILEHPDQEDILFKQFEILTNNFIKKAGIKTNEQRMDSTLVSPNIKKAGRLSLAHDVLHQAVRTIPTDLLSDTLKPVLEAYFKNDLLYKTRNDELDSRLQKVLDLMTEVDKLNQRNPLLYAREEMSILRRFLTEQAYYDQEQSKWLVKVAKDVKSSSLQSAYEQDATFRKKAGKKNSGYVLNLSETCSPENEVQFITDYKLEPNNKSDIEIAQDRLRGEDMNKLNVRGYIKSHTVCSYKVMARNIKQFVRLVKSHLPDIGQLCSKRMLNH